jgi:hypothetical protein
METTAERVGKNEAIFREANERIEQQAATAPMELVPFICECADPGCTAIVRMTLGEYEQIRSDGRSFLNVPGHEANALGHSEVVRRGDGYVVVEKIGRAAEVAEERDPRETATER